MPLDRKKINKLRKIAVDSFNPYSHDSYRRMVNTAAAFSGDGKTVKPVSDNMSKVYTGAMNATKRVSDNAVSGANKAVKAAGKMHQAAVNTYDGTVGPGGNPLAVGTMDDMTRIGKTYGKHAYTGWVDMTTKGAGTGIEPWMLDAAEQYELLSRRSAGQPGRLPSKKLFFTEYLKNSGRADEAAALNSKWDYIYPIISPYLDHYVQNNSEDIRFNSTGDSGLFDFLKYLKSHAGRVTAKEAVDSANIALSGVAHGGVNLAQDATTTVDHLLNPKHWGSGYVDRLISRYNQNWTDADRAAKAFRDWAGVDDNKLNRENIDVAVPVTSMATQMLVNPGELMSKVQNPALRGLQLAVTAADRSGDIGSSTGLLAELLDSSQYPQQSEQSQVQTQRQSAPTSSYYFTEADNSSKNIDILNSALKNGDYSALSDQEKQQIHEWLELSGWDGTPKHLEELLNTI